LPDQVGETISYKPKGDEEVNLEKYQPLVPRVDTTKKTRLVDSTSLLSFSDRDFILFS
jgi:hypothetical protein